MQRAQIVLACGTGETNPAIPKRMGLTGMTVGQWRKRYLEQGLQGLHDELRSGRPRSTSAVHPLRAVGSCSRRRRAFPAASRGGRADKG
ncbi:helix-turn-helix domain-containing protein [Synechococcus sp. HK01-R]|uniref:helix-turn-helix domain-containing protein n=1 Tax=Synechococcus sp. HK01-R TaxID=2751171 RepID=UPI0016260CEB|nr:helix-turn-helix domain-containing protein [Synechococcus sp. HK01-R]